MSVDTEQEEVIRSLKEAVAEEQQHHDHHEHVNGAVNGVNGHHDEADGCVVGKAAVEEELDVAVPEARGDADRRPERQEDQERKTDAPLVVHVQEAKHDEVQAEDAAPAEAKAESKAETPAVTKAETPTETKAETPAETKTETPAETKAETPAVTKAETPAETKAETPAVTKAETPVEIDAQDTRAPEPELRSRKPHHEWLSKRQSSQEMKREVDSQCRPTLTKAAMSTSVDEKSVRAAYEDVRSDTTDTQWAVYKFQDQNIVCSETGVGFDSFRANFGENERAFGFIRIQMGDEMSKRQKFVFITWVGPEVSVIRRAKMSIDKAMVKNIVKNFAVELQVEAQSDINEDYFREQLARAGGANYGTGFRD